MGQRWHYGLGPQTPVSHSSAKTNPDWFCLMPKRNRENLFGARSGTVLSGEILHFAMHEMPMGRGHAVYCRHRVKRIVRWEKA